MVLKCRSDAEAFAITPTGGRVGGRRMARWAVIGARGCISVYQEVAASVGIADHPTSLVVLLILHHRAPGRSVASLCNVGEAFAGRANPRLKTMLAQAFCTSLCSKEF
jgi:hypothetical protein